MKLRWGRLILIMPPNTPQVLAPRVLGDETAMLGPYLGRHIGRRDGLCMSRQCVLTTRVGAELKQLTWGSSRLRLAPGCCPGRLIPNAVTRR